MDTTARSPLTRETYREFLITRGPTRLRQLALVALASSPALFVLDLLLLKGMGDGGPSLGELALLRLPWVGVPLVVLGLRHFLGPDELPAACFWATTLFAVGNDWVFYELGLEGSGYHVVMVLLNMLIGPSLLPVGRWGRFSFYGLAWGAHLSFDLVLADLPVARLMALDVPLLVGSLAVGFLLESLHRGDHRQFLLRQELMQTLEELDASRMKVLQTGRTVALTAQTLSSTIAELSQQSSQVRLAAQRIATASEQMASAAGALLRQSRASATQAAEAQRYTGEVDALVSGMETSMVEIAEAVGRSAMSVQRLRENSERINGFVETIQEMAAATNMLALNAGIEAARAGEHGRGFAVVAREVGKLAEESGRSSAQIGAVVGGVTQQMGDTLLAVEQIRQTTERFTPVLESARTTLHSIREIVLQNQQLMVKSSEEADRQAEETAHISQACARLLELVDGHGQMSAEVAAAALQLGRLADELDKLLPEEAPRAAPALPR